MFSVGEYLQIVMDRESHIPKILHKTSRALIQGDLQTSFYEECKVMYESDGWDVKLWDDDMIDLFVAEHYPQYFKRFKEITPHIKQVDAVRYLFMHHYGGIYLDMDDECIRTPTKFIEGITKGPTAWMTGYPETHFLMSTPGNEFWIFAFEMILRDWKRYNVRSTGGPQGLNRMAKAYTMLKGRDAIRPFVMNDQSECDRIKPEGDVVCGEETYRWIVSRHDFPVSRDPVKYKIGFVPSGLFDPLACLERLGDCRYSHCHDRDDVLDSFSVHHCLFTWKSQASG